MRGRERTRQQLDPIGTLGSRSISVLFAAGAFSYGLVMTVRSFDRVASPALAILALLCLAAASLVVVVKTSQKRAPFPRSSHVLVHLLALTGIALAAAGHWGADRAIQDDFGPMALGLLVIALGAYRPAPELAAAGSLSAVFIGFLALLEVPALHPTAPTVSLVLVEMAPVLALSYGSASFSGAVARELEWWQRRARESVVDRTNQLHDGIVRSVQHDRIVILGRDVLPFFDSLLASGQVTDRDRVRAREIADSIRGVMVRQAERSWLQDLADQEGTGEAIGVTILDEGGRAARMGNGQRTAIRALILALLDERARRVGALRIELRGEGGRCTGSLVAILGGGEPWIRTELEPYLAVMRIVFSDLRVDHGPGTLTLKFSYEQR